MQEVMKATSVIPITSSNFF